MKRNVVIVIKSLTGGGAEKVAALLAQGFSERTYNVALITYADRNLDAYSLPCKVKRVDLYSELHTRNTLSKNVTLLKLIRDNIKDFKTDFVISFVHMVNIRTLIATAGLSIPVIVTEHADPKKSTLSRSWRIIRRICYPFSHQLVGVSDGVTEGFSWMSRRRTIYNPVETSCVGIEEKPKRRVIGTMGRLSPEKGYGRLINYFSKVADEFPDWDLVIYGEGKLRSSLESQIAKLGLGNRVSLPGFMSDSKQALASLDLFVVTSHFEGFCLVIVEAMAQKTPVISYDCPSGPAELIENDVNGILVENNDEKNMVKQMRRLMHSSSNRAQLAKAGYDSIGRFGLSAIICKWEELFQELCDDK